MVEERLEAWCNQDKKGRRPLPASIIFYRDGVGDSQFRVLREQEIYRIKQAYNAYRTRHNNPADPKSPKVTAIVVAKRHNVRFFPKDPRDPLEATNNGNCHPGLLVDSGVTSPYYMDFYLQAHNGLKGTAKPAHYIVLQDENNFSVDQIHDLVRFLSFGDYG